MLHHPLLAAWMTLSIALVAAGAWVRFDGPYVPSDQLLHGLLFFVSAFMFTIALICWLPLLRMLPDDRTAGRVVVAFVSAPALSMGLLVPLALESESASARRHREHLLRLARVVTEDFEARGRMPITIADALDRAAEPSLEPADADGGPLSYRRFDHRSAVLCAPERRVHALLDGTAITFEDWPTGEADPCRAGTHPNSYWSTVSR